MSKWNYKLKENSNGLTDVPGFVCSGVHADIRRRENGQLDLGVVYSENSCSAAGVFTKNRVKAAPVLLDQQILSDNSGIHAIVANSGNANACTGEQGMQNAEKMVSQVVASLGIPENSVFVCSTGRIGRQLPMEAVESGIHEAIQDLSDESQAGIDFANCILTSDTRNKKISVSVSDGEQVVKISGVAKGAGMIRPEMATMLAFVTTDLQIPQVELQALLSESTELSFNAITVDGDMSTNDTVLCLANGTSGINWSNTDEDFKGCFKQALLEVCEYLAYLIVGDGEKITKVVTLNISGGESVESAKKAAYSVAHSPLVKSSWAGSDPNWGRVIAAVGYSGVPIVESDLKMDYNDVPVFRNGVSLDENLSQWQEIVDDSKFEINLDLGMGDVSIRLIASDLTPEYITFNMKE